MTALVIPLLFACLVGCVATKSTSPAYMASPSYQQREAIDESLFPSDQAALSNADIEKILGAKIELPQQERLAILQLDGQASPWAWGQRADLDTDLAAALADQLSACARLRDVSLMPSLLVPKAKSAPALREAAARYQAGLLLVYRTRSAVYTDYRFAKKDQAKVLCTVDAFLLDVRTGIVPFSSAASSEFVAAGQREDFGMSETWRRAEKQALKEALAHMAADLVAFLETVP